MFKKGTAESGQSALLEGSVLAAKAFSTLKKSTMSMSQGKTAGTWGYIVLITESSGHHV